MLAVEVIVYLNQYHTSYDGESSHHVEIRAIGLGYLTDNPKRLERNYNKTSSTPEKKTKRNEY